MTTEVELKYLVVNDKVSQQIAALLTKQQISFEHQVKQLANCYFDTPDLSLRQLDMGLRTRTDDGKIEQTIKTAGQVVAGLHQRPEYNVEIGQAFPELALFPPEIWPDSSQVSALQAQLIPLFTTDFTREIWRLSIAGSEIELAFDRGEIKSGGLSETICEIELELLSGERADLFALAKLLFSDLAMRAGGQSKAARGYRLYTGKLKELKSTSLDICANHDGIMQYFSAGIAYSLTSLQEGIADYLASKKLTKLAEVVDVLSLIRHGFWLFEQHLPKDSQAIRSELSYFIQLFAWVDNAIYLRELMNKTGNYRKKLEYSSQLVEQLKIEKKHFPDYHMVKQLLHGERFNQLQLSLLILILNAKAQESVNQENGPELLSSFAKNKLSDNLIELEQGMSKVDEDNAEQFLAQRKLLHRSLLTGHWFGDLFDEQRRTEFRRPWLDIKVGLRELQSLWIIKQQFEKLDSENTLGKEKIINWQQGKVENLMAALSHSKSMALTMPAYWLN